MFLEKKIRQILRGLTHRAEEWGFKGTKGGNRSKGAVADLPQVSHAVGKDSWP